MVARGRPRVVESKQPEQVDDISHRYKNDRPNTVEGRLW